MYYNFWTLLSHEIFLIVRARICFLRLSSDFQNAVVLYFGNIVTNC